MANAESQQSTDGGSGQHRPAVADGVTSGGYKYAWGPLTEVPEGSTYDYALRWIEKGSRVLDIGSGPGYLAAVLSERLGCVVDCVEYNEEAVQSAARVCRRAVQADLRSSDWLGSMQDRYDFVVLLDVLEHVADPVRLAEDARSLLGEGGKLIASVPNVAHGAVRLPLLSGDWAYEPSGILDDSHLKFFVRGSFLETLGQSRLQVERLERVYRTVADDVVEEAATAAGTSADSLQALLSRTEGHTWQFIVQAVPVADRPPLEAHSVSVDRSSDLIERVRVAEREFAAYDRRLGWLRRAWGRLRRGMSRGV